MDCHQNQGVSPVVVRQSVECNPKSKLMQLGPLCSIVAIRGTQDWEAVLGDWGGRPGPRTADECRLVWLDSFASRVPRCIEVDVFGIVTVLVQEEPGRGCFLDPDGDPGMCFLSFDGNHEIARPGDAVRIRLRREMRPMRMLHGPASFQGELVKMLN